jgi:hypothetical protein
VKKYLTDSGSRYAQKHINIRRYEVIAPILSSDTLSYRQVVVNSSKESKKRLSNFKSFQDQINKDRSQISQDMGQFLAKENERMVKVMSKPQSIRLATDMILELHNPKNKGKGKPFINMSILE